MIVTVVGTNYIGGNLILLVQNNKVLTGSFFFNDVNIINKIVLVLKKSINTLYKNIEDNHFIVSLNKIFMITDNITIAPT